MPIRLEKKCLSRDAKEMSTLRFFLVCVFVLSPFVDMYNGYMQQFLDSHTIVPVIFKMMIILFSFRYILRTNRATILLRVFFLLLLFCYLYWEFSCYVDDLIELLRYVSKFIYPYSILIVLYVFRKKLNTDTLLHYVLAYGLICAVSILLSDLLGFSADSYGEDYGYGVKGLFNAGNDIGLSLILCNCVSAYYIGNGGDTKYILFNVILLITSLRIGSVAGMIGAVSVVLFLIMQPFFVRNKYSKNFYRYRHLLLWAGIPLIVYSVYLIMNTDAYTLEKFNIERLMSGGARAVLAEAFYAVSSDFTVADGLFGIGPNELFVRIAHYLGLYGTERALEVDHLELIGSFGFILGGLLLLYPIFYWLRCINYYVKERDSLSFWMAISFSLFVFHGIFAGHAFTSIVAMTVLVAFIFVADKMYYKIDRER